MRKGSLEVSEFEPRRVMEDAVPSQYPREPEDLLSRLRHEHRRLTSGVAALAALSLHVLFVAPAFWGGGADAQPQVRKYPGDTADLKWVVLESASGSSALIKRSSPDSPALRAIGVTEALAKLPTLPSEASDPGSGASDGESGLGALYGRYLGQIHARVDRAWLRPRTAIGAPIFECQVQVDQNGVGRVLAITLLDCNGGSSWKLSLVQAIEAASPLPAPPNPAVFVHHVLLEFRALAYSPAVSAQLYEPAALVASAYRPVESATLSQDPLERLAEAARAHSGKAIELRIEGSKVEVEPDHP